MPHSLDSFFLKRWYSSTPIWSLVPISYVYAALARVHHTLRKRFYRWEPPVPLIIVGNLTLGGVGKTPLVCAIAQHLQQQGWKVGIVSRGYGGKHYPTPHHIHPTDLASDVGDEPLWLAEMTTCPVIISKNRVAAARTLCEQHHVTVIISDDGLQHAALGRTVEIAVMDAKRGMGNGWLFPAGPLRESPTRLNTVDLRVINGGSLEGAHTMQRIPLGFYALHDPTTLLPLTTFQGKTVSAVTGIGDPQRFFNSLTPLGMHWTPFSFPNHHRFEATDLQHIPRPIIMTDKDAVKCRVLGQKDCYRLAMTVELGADFWQALEHYIA